MKIIHLLNIFLLSFLSNSYSQIVIDTNFEGSNIQVLQNSENTIKVKSILKGGDTRAITFFFKASNVNTTIPFNIKLFTIDQNYTPYLPAYSFDAINWYRLQGVYSGDSKIYTIANPQSVVYFSHGYPYLYSQMLNYLNGISASQYVSISDIAQSEQGRNIKLVKITEPCLSDSGKYSIWVIARNHAFESHSDYVIEGLMNFLISNDVKAKTLRRQAIIYIVPIMDVDMVFHGGSGKDQNPVDFNRDWDSPSYWNAVIAVKQKIIQTSISNPLKIFLDSHDPFPADESSLFVYSVDSTGIKSQNLNSFISMFQSNAGYNIDRLELYPTSGQSSTKWVDSVFTDIEFSISIETGWVSRTDNVQWTIPLYKLNGEMVGKSFSDYISNIIRPGDIIIDNTDSSNVIINGQWVSSTYTPGFWGINYIHDNDEGKGTKNVKYIPQIISSGDYEILLRWTSGTNRATNVPVHINYNNGFSDLIFNQQINGGRWVSAGIYNLYSGNNGNVIIKNDNTTGYVIADAVRFSKRNLSTVSIKNLSEKIPAKYTLTAYPNPFNPTTIIKFQIKDSRFVTLKVYDILGREVAALVNEFKKAGTYETQFPDNSVTNNQLPGGIYFCKLTVDNHTETIKLVELK